MWTMKRVFDILASLAGLVVMAPLFPLLSLAIKLDSAGPILYRQNRLGLNGRSFTILKFRTMVKDADRQRPITLKEDPRVIRVGRWLRRSKLDEMPTLVNVIKGDMGIVGPRPETPLYFERYSQKEQRVLSVRPGITDMATLRFNNEADFLGDEDHFEEIYLNEILPEKLRLNLEYIDRRSFLCDLRIIFATLFLMVRQRKG